jgi:ribosome maturation factor RimP
MKTEDRIERIRGIAERIADFTGVKIVRVEYVMEHGHHILRVIIDKPGGVGTKDCEEMSRALSKKLDEIDVIKEHYYLEVSSPGIDKEDVDSKD